MIQSGLFDDSVTQITQLSGCSHPECTAWERKFKSGLHCCNPEQEMPGCGFILETCHPHPTMPEQKHKYSRSPYRKVILIGRGRFENMQDFPQSP